jgi:Mn-dependent DtxR family transcriptional regulator
MKLKLNDDGFAVVQDGKPVYVNDDGKEIAFDVAGTVATISRLNSEAKGHRERAEAAEKAAKAFEGITDAEAARKALATVANLDAKKLVDAGEIDKVRAEAIKAVEDKYAPIVSERDGLLKSLVDEKVGGSFARSKMIADKLAIPADLVQARFGNAFKVEGNDVVAYDKSGNKLFSRSNPGEVAKFDEALEILIDQYPYRDSILKSTGASGGGAQSGNGGASGSKSMSRAAFDALPPAKQAEVARSGTTFTD